MKFSFPFIIILQPIIVNQKRIQILAIFTNISWPFGSGKSQVRREGKRIIKKLVVNVESAQIAHILPNTLFNNRMIKNLIASLLGQFHFLQDKYYKLRNAHSLKSPDERRGVMGVVQ